MTPPDAELIARVIASDNRHAFAQLVRRYQSPVRALLRRLTCGDDALADDLAQETFLRAYRGLGQYRGGARFSSWVYRIAFNVFVSQKQRRRLDTESLDNEASDLPASAGTRPPESAAHLDVTAALVVLSEPERASIALAFGLGATHEEIAEVLGCPLGTAKSHVLRAKEKLRRRLSAWAPEEAMS